MGNVFWMLFGAEQNRDLLPSLLNAVLQPPAPIEWAEVQHAEPERLGVDDKSIALDVRVRLANGEQIDVEMQTQRHSALRERALYYWARLYVGQQQHGSPYSHLRRCAVIWITNFNELAGRRFHSIFGLREVRDALPLTDHLEVHLLERRSVCSHRVLGPSWWGRHAPPPSAEVNSAEPPPTRRRLKSLTRELRCPSKPFVALELPKLREALDRNDEPTLVAWARFLTAKNDEDLETLAMENPVLKQAKDALDRLSADPDARVRAEQREMALFSYELGLSTAHRDGIAHALQQLLTTKFGPLPGATLVRLAGASREELEKWVVRVLSAETLEDVFVAECP